MADVAGREKDDDFLKRHGNLFSQVVEYDNLYLAYEIARRGKRWQRAVQEFEQDVAGHLRRLQKELRSHTFHTSAYRCKTIYEPKERVIYILPFYPDRIVQHALMNVIEPIWDGLFLSDSYACRKDKGLHAGSQQTMKFVRRNRYCLKCDISKFYPSIDHAVAMEIIERKIKDKGVLWLFRDILSSVAGERNVPIGNYTSQWIGNLYLNELDTFVKQELRVKNYVRYCDDFLLFFNDKKELGNMAEKVRTFCKERLKLRLSKCDLFPTSRGVDFLGYRHFPAGYLLLRKSTAKRMKQRARAIPYELKHGILTKERALSAVMSMKGWMKHANTHHLALTMELDALERFVRGWEGTEREAVF